MSKNIKVNLIIAALLGLALMAIVSLQAGKQSVDEQIRHSEETQKLLEAFARALPEPQKLAPYLHPSLPLSYLANPMVAPTFAVGELQAYHGIQAVMPSPDAVDGQVADVVVRAEYANGEALLDLQLRKDAASQGQWKVSDVKFAPPKSESAEPDHYHP